MGLYYYGLQVTSAAYSVVFLDLIPIVTFVIAILVRYANKPSIHGSLVVCMSPICACDVMHMQMHSEPRRWRWGSGLAG
jgi:hypothetical protein